MLYMVKDYDGKVLYHPCKVNVVVDTFSWKLVDDPLR